MTPMMRTKITTDETRHSSARRPEANTLRKKAVRTIHIGTVCHDDLNDTDETRNELDSHADAVVIGPDTALIIHDFESPVYVSGYKDSVG